MHTDFYNTHSELQQKNNKSWQGSQNKRYRPVIFVSEYTSSPGKVMLFLAFSLNVVEIPLYKRYIVRKSLLTTFHFNRFIAARKPSCIHFFTGKKGQRKPLTPAGSEKNGLAPHLKVKLIYNPPSRAGACPAASWQR